MHWSPRTWWGRLDEGWRLALTLLLAQRIVLGLIGVFSAATADHLKLPGELWPQFTIRGGEPGSLLLHTWHHWDAVRYYALAQNAYDGGAGAVQGGLYPLYPLLARVVSFLFGGHLLWAELAVSSVAFVVSMRLLYSLAMLESQSGTESQPATSAPATRRGTRRRQPPSAGNITQSQQRARAVVLLTALFPTGFFLLAPYTESLFLTLTIAMFWYARRGSWWLAGMIGLLASLTRIPGIFLFAPLLFEYARQHHLVAWMRRRGGGPPKWDLLATTLPLLGAMIVPLAISVLRGSDRAGVLFRSLEFAGERALGARPASDLLGSFGLQVVPPWESVSASVSYVTRWVASPPSSLPIIEAVNLAALLGFCVLGVFATRRLPAAYALYVWPSLLMLLVRQVGFSPLMSVSRYVLVIIPCLMVLGFLLAERRRIFIGWIVVSAAIQGALFWYYARAGFVA